MKKIIHILICLSILCISSGGLCGQYQDITRDLGIVHTYINNDHIGGGVAIVDINSDGWLDMVFTGGESPDRLFMNLGDGEFEDVSEALIKPDAGDITSSIVSGDFNNDGCPDLYVSVYNRDRPDFILVNNCETGFEIKQTDVFGNSIGATLFDFNKDGLLDVYAIGYVEEPKSVTDEQDRIIAYDHTCGDNSLILNNGDLNFTNKSSEYLSKGAGCSLAVSIIPLADKQTHGIYIANDFGEFLHPNQLLVLNENSVFEDQAPVYGLDKAMYGMGIAIGDYDNDLDFDIYVSNLGENVFYQNETDAFTEVQQDLGVENTYTPDGQFATSWGTFFLDVDNDADLDLFVANGFLFAPEFIGTSFIDPNQLYLNQDGNYTQTSSNYGISVRGAGINRGAAKGDLDNDGDLDIVVSYINFEPTNHQQLIYRVYDNRSNNQNNYVKIKLEASTSAPDAFGSQIILHSKDKSLLEYHYSSAIHCSQNTPFIHFGLADINKIDSIEIIWPNFIRTVHDNIPLNSMIQIKEGKDEIEIFGCTDENSASFNAQATIDLFCESNTTTATVDVTQDQLQIASNNSTFSINYDNNENTMFEIFDIVGKLVLRQQLEKLQNGNTLIIPDLPSGIYVWSLSQHDQKKSDKFFIH